MERVIPNYNSEKNKYIVLDSSSNYFLLDLKDRKGLVNIGLQQDIVFDLLLINYENVDEIHFDVNKGTKVKVASLMHFAKKEVKITADVDKNGAFAAYFADFMTDDAKVNVTVNLNGENATCDWHLASLCEKNEQKEFDVSVYHNAPNTYSHIDNYGVTRDHGKLTFAGVSKIANDNHGSKAHQNAKIMVFDPESVGIAKPILLIDENDLEASHAAVVGKINDEHIFYLTSRGLTTDEAKRIITFGYLKPIMRGFEEQEMKDDIEALIEGKI